MCRQYAHSIHALLLQYKCTESQTSEKLFKGSEMKNLILASLLALGFSAVYADGEKAAMELEHANKTANSVEGYAGDMSEMKAKGKCNADQSAKKKKVVKKPARKPTKAELELEHANKLATGDDSVDGDMKDMKAQGKCNTGK